MSDELNISHLYITVLQLRSMEIELRNAPGSYQVEVNRRISRYRAELTRLRQNMVNIHWCVSLAITTLLHRDNNQNAVNY